MFLVTPQQLNRLNHSVPSASNAEIMRHTVENDLDEKMRAILNEDGMNAYEKIKKYNALLQRYLALVKQGEKEERHITLTVAKDSEALKQRVEGGEEEEEDKKLDETAREVVQNLPARYRNNAQYIIKKLTKSRGGWTPRGEFVYNGDVVKGSHLLDLFKSLTVSLKKSQPPKGWTGFLNTLSELNIPLSMMSNPQA